MQKLCKKMSNVLMTLVLILSLLAGVCVAPVDVSADALRTGVVTCSPGGTVNTRESASASSNIVNKLANGKPLTILAETTGADGYIWYQVSYVLDRNGQTVTAYMRSDYVTITSQPTAPVEGEYADYLRGLGFPESYLAPLCALHEKYPNWVFEPVLTGIDWNTAVTKESVNGKNLVEISADDAKKSTASGAYDWNTNTWTIYDGSRWVSAHPDYIAYCMDPRNFLDEASVFMFENLAYSENQNLAGVQAVLKDSFMAGNFTDTDGATYNYAQTFLDIGQAVGASPYFLASRVRQEQGTGKSPMISGTYPGFEGYFNYFNYNAYGTTSAAVLQSGLSAAKNNGWNTRYKSLKGGAEKIAKNYINVGQDTLYFQKFNVVNKANLFGHQYMTNVTAAITESKKVAAGYMDKNQSFVFRIPVYDNMPASAVNFTASGNPNNYLKSLSVAGQSLTPAFSSGTTSYSMVVANSVSSVSVSAKAVVSSSSIAGTGNYNLAVGSNTIRVDCTSQSGQTRSYTITIVRQGAITPADGQGVSSSTYKVGTTITGVAPGTGAASFLQALSVPDGSIKLLTSAGAENTGTVGTGNKVVWYRADGTQAAVYEVVIYGDVNGDGAVDILDMVKANRHIIGLSSLTGSYLEAGDANRKQDGVDILDMVKMNRHILGLTTIQQ